MLEDLLYGVSDFSADTVTGNEGNLAGGERSVRNKSEQHARCRRRHIL